MIRCVSALLLAVGATACRPAAGASGAELAPRAEAPTLAVPGASTSAPPSSTLSAPPDGGGGAGGVWLERIPVAPRLESAPIVELLAPFSGAVIPVEKAAASRVRVATIGWSLVAGGDGVAVALDGDRPRVLRQPPVELLLGELPSDGRSVGPGRHRLVAAAVDAEGLVVRPPPRVSRGSIAVVDFFVGARGELPPDAPFLFLASPPDPGDGGPLAGAPLIDCVAVGASVAAGEARLAIELMGPGGRSAVDLGDDEPRRIHGLVPGDHVVELVLAAGEGPTLHVLDRVRRAFAAGPAAERAGASPSRAGGMEP